MPIISADLFNDDDNITFPKPIIKWVGGKTQILNKLIDKFPKEINNYREPFIGGGSVLLAVLTQIKCKKIKISGRIFASDVNDALINLYKNIQSNHEILYNELQNIINEYNNCDNKKTNLNRKPKTIDDAKLCKENYYYWIRQEYNKTENKNTPYCSAMFIFLNKTCFRGVFRIGPHGFNVPFGNYINPEIINKKHLNDIHDLIKDVVFECCNFEDALNNVQNDDFIYLDPPYVPITATSFVGYTADGFNKHEHLFNIIDTLTTQNKKIILSNTDVAIVREHFTDDKYNTEIVLCKRKINSKTPQSKTNEVIIQNY